MKVHHLNCATLCPPAAQLEAKLRSTLQASRLGSLASSLVGALSSSFGAPFAGPLINESGVLVCHCLLVEAPGGLVLIDTGLGTQDVRADAPRVSDGFRRMTGPVLRVEETALQQLRALGYHASDVRHVIVTHLDPDHAGGLSDFPEATVHLHADELAAAQAPGLKERARYTAAQWTHGPRWSPQRPGGERWFGFEAARDLPGLPPEILLIPLAGHTRGHSAVAVKASGGWLLHAGDAYFFHGETDPDRPHCTPGLTVVQRLDDHDHAARVKNQVRLRALRREHGGEVRIFCSHDPSELEALRRAA